MNGRFYDPIPARMLSADNYVQDPGNSQSYNRYAYVFNNPMKYTDPSGEIGILAALGVAAIVAGVSYLINAGKNGWEIDPRKWTSGDGVGIGFTTNSAGTTNLYGFGNAGGVSWTGGAGINGDGFGGGLSTFGQASYNQMPSAGTGSINWNSVNNQRNADIANHQFEESSDFDNWSSNAVDIAFMTAAWVSGARIPNGGSMYFVNDEITNALRNAPGIVQAREKYYKYETTSGDAPFGASGYWNAKGDPVESFVGTFDYEIIKIDNTLQFTITNRTSMSSFVPHPQGFYIWPDSWNPTSGPFSNFNQTYIFTEPIR